MITDSDISRILGRPVSITGRPVNNKLVNSTTYVDDSGTTFRIILDVFVDDNDERSCYLCFVNEDTGESISMNMLNSVSLLSDKLFKLQESFHRM